MDTVEGKIIKIDGDSPTGVIISELTNAMMCHLTKSVIAAIMMGKLIPSINIPLPEDPEDAVAFLTVNTLINGLACAIGNIKDKDVRELVSHMVSETIKNMVEIKTKEFEQKDELVKIKES
jgi:hypothetical protein